MPENNGQRTTNEWLQVIYRENEAAHREIRGQLESMEKKLDGKTEKADCEKKHECLDARVEKVENKTQRLAIKVGGISALMTAAGVWLKATFFGS